jgi:hypothetical protein
MICKRDANVNDVGRRRHESRVRIATELTESDLQTDSDCGNAETTLE